MKTVAVTGANGFIGTHVCAELVRRGCAVRALVRSLPAHTESLQTSGHFVRVDFDDPVEVSQALEGIDAVAHLVGHSHQRRTETAIYTQVNVGYTRRVLEAAVEVGVARFLYLSS